jgi:hypothetical protein
MAISGSLEDVAVADVLQFISIGKRTGTLELARDGDRARFGFYEGTLITAQAPGAPRLGELLLEGRHVDAEALREAMTEQTAGGTRRSLGSLLVDAGKLDSKVLQEVVKQQLERAVERVLSWERGSFDFAIDEIRPVDDIGVETAELVGAEKLAGNVVLLEAARIFDEKSRPGVEHERDTLVDAAVRALTDEAESLPEGAPGEPRPQVDSSVRRLQRMLGELRSGLASATVALNLMQIISESFERAVLLLVKREKMTVLGAFGTAADGRPLANAVRRLEIAPSGALLTCLATSQVQTTRFAEADLPGGFAASLGAPVNDRIVVLPVSGTERVIALVYADNGDVERAPKDVELLEVAASQVGIALENELLRRRLERGRGASV